MPQPDQQQTNVLDDPEFHALPAGEKHKVLMATDPDYRGMQPSEQAKALDEIHYGNLGRLTPDKGAKSTMWEDIKGLMPESAGHIQSRVHSMSDQDLRQASSDAPHQNLTTRAENNYSQRRGEGRGLAYSIGATALEGATPVNVEGMEEAGREGHPGEVMGHGLAGALEVAGPEAVRQLPLGEGIARTMRRPDQALRSGIKPVSRVAGALAGGAAGRATGIPEAGWVGAGAGGAYAPKLIDAIVPERSVPELGIADEATREGQAEALRLKDQIEREGPRTSKPAKPGKPDPFQGPGMTSSQNPTAKPDLPKPKLSAKETGEYLKSKGQSVGKLREDLDSNVDNTGSAPAAAPGKEKLSSAMQRKVDEAQGRYDARRMAEHGAERDEDSRTTPSINKEYDPSKPSHWINPDGKIESGSDHSAMEGSKIRAEKKAAQGTLQVNLHGQDAVVIESHQHPTPEQIRGAAKLFKDSGRSKIWYYQHEQPNMSPGTGDFEEFRTIGGLQRYLDSRTGGTGHASLSDAISDSQEAGKGRPVSRKGQDSKTPKGITDIAWPRLKNWIDKNWESGGINRLSSQQTLNKAKDSGVLTDEEHSAFSEEWKRARDRSVVRDKKNLQHPAVKLYQNKGMKGDIDWQSSADQRAKEVSPMDPREKADLEKSAGKKLSDAEAYEYRRKSQEWTGNQALAKGKVDTDVKQSAGLRDAQKKAGYGKTKGKSKKSLKDDIDN